MTSRKYIASIQPIALIIGICLFGIYYNASGQAQTGVLQDPDGNSYATKILLDNKQWMTDNLRINIPGSYCYGDQELNCGKYGRLYTWESAQKGCAALGKGWRLPTNEEWRQLARRYADSSDDPAFIRKAAYKVLLTGGSSGLNILLGGGSDPEVGYKRLDAHGFYWTATENDAGTAWFSNFGKGSQMLFHQPDGEKSRAFSVRCIKE